MKMLCGKAEFNYYYDLNTKEKSMSISLITNIENHINDYKIGGKFTLQLGKELYCGLTLATIIDSENGKLGHFTGVFKSYPILLDMVVVN